MADINVKVSQGNTIRGVRVGQQNAVKVIYCMTNHILRNIRVGQQNVVKVIFF
jgi:hypothetical protein